MIERPNIAIVGVGSGGLALALARIIQRHHAFCSVKIYEADPSPTARQQGGSLDIKADSGQDVLRKAGLYEEFLRLSRLEGDDTRIYGKHAQCLWQAGGGGDDRTSEEEEGKRNHSKGEERGCEQAYNPESDRADLQRILLESLLPGTVEWDHKLVSISGPDEVNETSQEAKEEGKGTSPMRTKETAMEGESEERERNRGSGLRQYRMHFSNGNSITTDFIVGADGAWSRVRPSVSAAKPPLYSGITLVDITFSDFGTHHPGLSSVVGNGTAFFLSDEKGLITQRNGNGVLRVYIALRVAEDWSSMSSVATATTTDEKRTILLETYFFSDWDKGLQQLIAGTRQGSVGEERKQDSLVIRPVFALPVPPSWPNKPRITLTGDAAHLMSPFAGEGVNMALTDAAELAEALLRSLSRQGAPETLYTEVHGYEEFLALRATEAAAESAANLQLFFSVGSPQSVVELFQSYGPPAPDAEQHVDRLQDQSIAAAN